MTTGFFILVRAVHFGACLLFFGIFAFDRLVAASIFDNNRMEAAQYWKSRLNIFGLVLLPLILLSGVAWFVLVAMTMSGQPPQFAILKIVWLQTQFGMVWKFRLLIWISSAVAAVTFTFLKPQNLSIKKLVWLQLLLGGLLLGSLAWVGHGQEDSRWHLFADVLHLLVAGLWPTGLLPFAMLLRRLREASEPALVPFVHRFSALSLACVSLLALTGIINACYLVGSFSNLFNQPYGRWLLLKIVLFCVAIAIGAVNLLRLRPQLTVEGIQSPSAQAAAARLQSNVQLELILGAIVVIVVAVLGILPP
jgi:putative copper export protein